MIAPRAPGYRPRLLVVGYRKFSELVSSVVEEFDDELDISIVDSVASGTTNYDDLVAQYRPDVIASAGSNASYLASTLDLPVVSQPVSDADLIQALAKAAKLSRRVHLFTYQAPREEPSELLATLPELLDIDLVCHPYSTSAEAGEKLALACADEKASVVVGPSYTYHLAERYGVPSILVYSKASSRALLSKALDAARQSRDEQFRAAVREILFDDPHEHLVICDADGQVTQSNELAREAWSLDTRSAVAAKRDLGLDTDADDDEVRDRLLVIDGESWFQRRHAIRVRGEPLGYVFRYLPQHAYRPRPVAGSDGSEAEFIIQSSEMHEVARLARTYALTGGAVLIQGESGTGKEHIAREIHAAGPFAEGALVPLNCGGIPSELFESELFGYVDGAFTNSRRGGHAGLIQRAENGVLFLDEVAELPLDQQSKLLRVLQQKSVRPVGGSNEIAVNFKVVAATNRDLAQRVSEGLFREDLYYRLNVFALRLPALRERPDDIGAITRYYLQRFARLYPASINSARLYESVRARFEAHPWPGNVRELENYCERLVVNCLDSGETTLDERRLQRVIPELYRPSGLPDSSRASLKAKEAQAIQDAMARFNDDRARVAEYLGISTTTLWRRLKSMENNSRIAGNQ